MDDDQGQGRGKPRRQTHSETGGQPRRGFREIKRGNGGFQMQAEADPTRSGFRGTQGKASDASAGGGRILPAPNAQTVRQPREKFRKYGGRGSDFF